MATPGKAGTARDKLISMLNPHLGAAVGFDIKGLNFTLVVWLPGKTVHGQIPNQIDGIPISVVMVETIRPPRK